MTRGGAAGKQRARQLLYLIAAAALVRALLFAARGDYLDWDEALYLQMARNLMEGAGLTLNGYPHVALGPLVPLATATLAHLPGLDPLLAQRALMVLGGALLILPAHYLMRRAAGPRAAWLGAILLVGWPALIDVAPKLGPMWRHNYAGTEPLYLGLLFGALALGEAGLAADGRRRFGALGLAGLCLGLAYLARPEALAVGGLYVAVRAAPAYRRERPALFGGAALTAGLGFLIVVLPYLAHVHRVSGAWTPSGKLGPTRAAADLYQRLVRDDRYMGDYLSVWWALEPGHERLLNPYWGGARGDFEGRMITFSAALDDGVGSTAAAPRAVLSRARDHILAVFAVVGFVYLPFALMGLLWPGGSWRERAPPFVVAGLTASILTAGVVFALPRFFLYLVPAFALWGGRGLARATDWIRARGLDLPDRAFALALLIAGVMVAATRTLAPEANALRKLAIENRLAGQRLKGALPEGSAVMAWHPRLAYWAQREWRALPVAPLDAALHYAAERGVRHLLLARGMYSPLELRAPYVLLVLDEAASRALARVDADGLHRHPGLALQPSEPVAGFPTGRVRPGESDRSIGSDAGVGDGGP